MQISPCNHAVFQEAAVKACLPYDVRWGDCSAGKAQISSIWTWQTEQCVDKRIQWEFRASEVTGLACGPSRRKKQELQELELETGDKATTQIHCLSGRQDWRPAQLYHSWSRDWRIVSGLSWGSWALGRRCERKPQVSLLRELLLGHSGTREIFRKKQWIYLHTGIVSHLRSCLWSPAKDIASHWKWLMFQISYLKGKII